MSTFPLRRSVPWLGRTHSGMEESAAGALIEADFPAFLQALREGTESAWVALYDDVAPTILGYLTAQRAPTPEDTTSEVLLQVVRDLDQFAGDYASFRSWVFTIAHHRMIDARRRSQRRPSDPTEDEELERRLDPEESFEQDVLDAVSTEELEVLFAVLTDDQRDVLYLKVMGGLNLVEVADVLGKNHEAVRGLQKRALAALRQHLATNPYPFEGVEALSWMR